MADIESSIDRAIPFFVNHTDHGGDWEGSATIAPFWTSSTLIAAIGDTARLPVPDVGYSPIPWLYQQYKMLNQLRWTRSYKQTVTENLAHRVFVQIRRGFAPYATSMADTYAAALADWYADTYAADDELDVFEHVGYKADAYSAEIHGGRSYQRLTGLPTSIACAIDWYWSIIGPGADINTFDDEALGLTENAWHKGAVDSAGTASTRSSAYFGDGAVAPPEPADPGVGEYVARGWVAGQPANATGGVAILKWDVTDGFAFLA